MAKPSSPPARSYSQAFSITIELHFPFDDRSPALKRALFSSLFFPSVVKLNLELMDHDHEVDDDPVWEGDVEMKYSYFNKEIPRIFRHIEQFPRVSKFHLKVRSAFSSHRGIMSGETFISIPLNMLPDLKRFTLESDARLEMSEPPDETNFEDGVPPRVVGDVLPVLDTIVLDLPHAGVVAEWVCDYLQGLRDQERSGFRELIIMKGNASKGRRKVSYLGDYAFEWTRRHLGEYP